MQEVGGSVEAEMIKLSRDNFPLKAIKLQNLLEQSILLSRTFYKIVPEADDCFSQRRESCTCSIQQTISLQTSTERCDKTSVGAPPFSTLRKISTKAHNKLDIICLQREWERDSRFLKRSRK